MKEFHFTSLWLFYGFNKQQNAKVLGWKMYSIMLWSRTVTMLALVHNKVQRGKKRASMSTEAVDNILLPAPLPAAVPSTSATSYEWDWSTHIVDSFKEQTLSLKIPTHLMCLWLKFCWSSATFLSLPHKFGLSVLTLFYPSRQNASWSWSLFTDHWRSQGMGRWVRKNISPQGPFSRFQLWLEFHEDVCLFNLFCFKFYLYYFTVTFWQIYLHPWKQSEHSIMANNIIFSNNYFGQYWDGDY